MNKKSIKYIYFFDTQDSEIKRNYVTSACNKIEYIASAISSHDRDVDIISMSEVIEDKFKIFPSEEKKLNERITLHLPLSWGGSNFLITKLRIVWHLLNMFVYLLFNCKKDEPVIVYHSLGYFDIIRWAKKLKKFKLILEVEEIYSDVSQMSPYWRNLEYKMFDIADAFILSNDLLDSKINHHHKPSIVIYGTYQVEPKRVEKFNDGKIHIIYAGTFDPDKGGAQIAITAAEHLPENYHLHICGFGSLQDVEFVKQMITDVQVKSKATITYDGLKKGDEFICFLQQCHIGLSTQKPEGEYNDTSFPSKVLSYIANGLAVVSIRIPVLQKAAVSSVLTFYDKPEGKLIADAILHCKYNSSSRVLLDELDKCFKNKILTII